MNKLEKDSLCKPIALDVIRMFGDDDLISHEWLKRKFGIETPSLEDFDNDVAALLEAVKLQQFEYMNCVESLRDCLIDEFCICIRNDHGQGYRIVKASEQVEYGYNRMSKDVAKAFKDAKSIMTNVRNVPSEQQSRDNDLRAKAAMMEMFFKNSK